VSIKGQLSGPIMHLGAARRKRAQSGKCFSGIAGDACGGIRLLGPVRNCGAHLCYDLRGEPCETYPSYIPPMASPVADQTRGFESRASK
jgi:hypothetical protein